MNEENYLSLLKFYGIVLPLIIAGATTCIVWLNKHYRMREKEIVENARVREKELVEKSVGASAVVKIYEHIADMQEDFKNFEDRMDKADEKSKEDAHFLFKSFQEFTKTITELLLRKSN